MRTAGARLLCPWSSVTFKLVLYILLTVFPSSTLIKSRLTVCLPHKYVPQKGGFFVPFPFRRAGLLALGWTKRAQIILHSCEFSKANPL